MLLRRSLLARLSATAAAGVLVSSGRAGADPAARQTVLIIRHADKPDPGHAGVDANGVSSPTSLVPRGWQRAGMWTELFAPSLGQPPALPVPRAIFASAPRSPGQAAAGQGGSKSRRPLETVTALAEKLATEVDLRFGKGREADLAAAVAQMSGVTLVCWQNPDLLVIAKALAPDAKGVPNQWPSDCFNVVLRFDRPDPASPWTLQQIVPAMLKGDRSEPI